MFSYIKVIEIDKYFYFFLVYKRRIHTKYLPEQSLIIYGTDIEQSLKRTL